MTVLSTKHIQELETACQELSKEDQVRHVGVINSLGNLVAGGFKKGITPLLDDGNMDMLYMQMQLDFKMRKELDDLLGSVDYIASRRTKNLVINVPVGENLVLITAEPDADDKSIIKKAEKLFDEITISTI